VPPEEDVVGGERLAVGPLQPLPQRQGERGAVRIEFPLLGQTRLNGVLWIARPTQHRVVVLATVGMEVGRARPGQTPRATVLADPLNRLDYLRAGRQALLNGRQFASL